MQLLVEQMQLFFHDVSIVKPRSSRSTSTESFIVCQKLIKRNDYVVFGESVNHGSLGLRSKGIQSFVETGDLSVFDHDNVRDTLIS
jgi:hypothetical protein